jgi:hypothetical protein
VYHAGVNATMTDPIEADLGAAIAALDREAVRATFQGQNEFVVLERWLPPSLVDRLRVDLERVRPAVHRNYIPRHKKGGSVGAHHLAREAPAITALYRSGTFLEFVRAITGQPLVACPPRDPHAYALYFYTEPGDHIGFHFDTSYYRGARYTILVGLIERSSSRLVCDPYKKLAGHPPGEVRLATEPGTLVLFNGDTLWHGITPLGPGEERVSLTLEYVTDPGMHPLKRVVSDLKDAVAYFGFRSVFTGAR